MNIINKKYFFPAIATVLLGGPQIVHAQSTVTVYGMVDAGIEVSNAGKGTQTRMITGGTGGSRVGFRGREDLGNGFAASFQLEMGFATDTGSLTQGGKGFGRGTNIGLQHKDTGTLLLGLVNLPYYQVQSKVDAFDWRVNGGLMAISRPTEQNVERVLAVTTSARAENAVAFISNVHNGFQFRVLGAMSEKSDKQGHTYSASLSYNKKPLDFYLGYAQIEASQASNGKAEAYVTGGSYDFDKFKVYTGYTVEKNSCRSCTGSLKMGGGVADKGASEFHLINLGVRIPHGKATWIAQGVRILDKSDYFMSPGSRHSNWFAIGMEYRISKRTLLYSSIGTLDNKNGSSYGLGTGTSSATAGSVDSNNPRVTSASLGIRHNF